MTEPEEENESPREKLTAALEGPRGTLLESRASGASGYPLFFVRERNVEGRAWWTTRGAQQFAGKSLIRVHDHPDAEAVVRDADFLESCPLRTENERRVTATSGLILRLSPETTTLRFER